MPPPIANLITPTITTMVQIFFPLSALDTLLMIKPTTAIGTTIQFNQPNNGINATSMANKHMIPRSKDTVFINLII